jgi:two-component system nitrate/nitrite response regulator NarL
MKPEPAGKTRILIVDDHVLFCEGLVRLLETEPDLVVAGHCATVDEALRILDRKPVDIVLLDYDLGLQRGSEFLLRVQERGSQLRVLILTAGLSDLDAARLIQDGAAGIFLKHSPLSALAKSIRKVMSGEPWIDSRYLSVLLRPDIRAHQEGHSLRLTERERSILRGVFQGLANKEIADRLKISETSVKAALQQLFRKTGVRTRGQLVRVALERYRDQLSP